MSAIANVVPIEAEPSLGAAAEGFLARCNLDDDSLALVRAAPAAGRLAPARAHGQPAAR
jgi:hypothetical protein